MSYSIEASETIPANTKLTVMARAVRFIGDECDYSAEVSKTVTITSTPAWVKKKPGVKVTQKDDDYVTMVLTKVVAGYDTGIDYVFTVDGDDPLDGEYWGDCWEVSEDEKTYTIQIPMQADGNSHTFDVQAHGYNTVAENDFYSGTGSAKVTLKPMWSTKPTLKATYGGVGMYAEVTVTYKGSPTGATVEYSADGKTWYEDLDDLNAVLWEKDQSEVDCWQSWDDYDQHTGSLWIMAQAPTTFYVRVTMQKNGEEGTPSAALKLSFQPKWATTDLKLKATQTGENTVSFSFTAVKDAEYYEFWICGENEYEAYIDPADAPDLNYGKYVIYGRAFKDDMGGKTFE